MREIYQEHLTATPLSQENLHIILEDYETYLPSETLKQNYSTKTSTREIILEPGVYGH